MKSYRFVWLYFVIPFLSLDIESWAEAERIITTTSLSTHFVAHSIHTAKTFAMAIDTDYDGVDNASDLDDDNDGIFDTAEAVGGNNPLGDADGDGTPNYLDVTDDAGSGDGSSTDYTDSDNNGIPDVYDVDGDGIPNHLDLDSDNDGIPDNIEAQMTLGYNAPNADNAATYTANNGLNSAYTASGGITPIDTDGNNAENLPDYLDINSDDEGENDTKEAGFVVAANASDVDHDGLLDAYERGTPNDGYVSNDGITNPSAIFADSDSDVNFGGDVDYRDAINDAQGILCGPVSTLYQTVGNSTTGKAEVYRYNPFLQQYLKVGELEGVDNNSATNSAYNAVTQKVYSSIGGQTLRVYDPANDFAFVGNINIIGTAEAFTNVLFAQDNLLGFIKNNKIIKFDVSSITSYPATVNVTEKAITGTFSTSNDYALVGDYIYGVTGLNPARLVKVHVNTGVSTRFDLVYANNTTNNDVPDGSYGASWQDRFGNLYTFNNKNGDIYKIAAVANAATGTALTKILLAAPSGQNDGFGCELNPDPLDWDGDLISDDVDIDDDNDGILDTVEDANLDGDNDPLTNFTDTDGDNIPNGYDLDSDGDGLPDNVEAQTTVGYIAPSGVYDANGLDTAYPGGLSAVNTDATFPNPDAIPDYLDVDSDNDGIYDLVEANLVLSHKDYDGDGLDNNIDTVVGLGDPNGIINNPSALPNTDGVGDIDVRDAKDTDGDGIQDVADDDDDNDGIPDTQEVAGTYDPLGDADGDGAPNFSDVSNGGGGGDGSSTDYTDSDGNGIPDVYDVDGDGIPNHLDLDSDNDGIYDAVEAGHGQAQTAGRVDGPVGTDGLPDAVQGIRNENSSTINYILADTDTDNAADFLETDADGDGCNDVKEAGFTDGDNNDFLGSGTFGSGLMVNATGVVTSGSDGYTTPNANYTNPTIKIACNRPPTAANKILTTNEDTPVTIATADLGYSDLDGDPISKITINTVPAAGILFLDADGNNEVDTNEALDANDVVTLIQMDAGKLKFLPAANGNGSGYGNFTFTVNDGFVDAASSNTITFDVAAVNDAPTAADNTITVIENSTYTFSLTDFGYADIEGAAMDHIEMTGLPDRGTLFLDADENGVADAGETVSLNQNIVASDISKLKFEPTASEYGTGYTGFSFNVNDGSLYAIEDHTITINVNHINQLPGAADKTLSTQEDTPITIIASDLGYSDPDGDELRKITINTAPSNGNLFLDVNGNNLLDNSEILANGSAVTKAQLDAGQLKFLPVSNENGLSYTSFDFTVNDGIADATASNTIIFGVEAVNDAPVISQVVVSGSVNHTVSFEASDFTDQFQDVEGSALTKIKITSLPTNGALWVGGNPVVVNDEIQSTDLSSLIFIPAANYQGLASFGWNGFDGTAYAANQAEVQITISTQQAPTVTGGNKSTNEETALRFTATDFANAFSDADGDTLQKIQIIRLPANGQLLLNGNALKINDEIPVADLDQLTFVPNNNFFGNTSFDWNGYDGTAYANSVATLNIAVVSVDDHALVASGKTFTLAAGAPLNPASLTDAVTDPEGQGLTFQTTPTADVSHGSLTIYPDGTFTYIPAAGYVGADSFTYQVCDGGNPQECTTGTVTLEIGDQNQDADSDQDGIPDIIEIGNDPAHPADTDGDGIPDFKETDSDGDGIPDSEEAGNDPAHPTDTDGDGIPDFQETDSDGDGTPDGEEDVITIYKGFSPNGDGKNEVWWIEDIEKYPNNRVQIFNRWGNKIFDMKSYNNQDRAWGSQSSIGLIVGNAGVPDGTYFYIIDLGDNSAPRKGYVMVHR